jgi:hypothetical protein
MNFTSYPEHDKRRRYVRRGVIHLCTCVMMNFNDQSRSCHPERSEGSEQ